MLQHEQIVNVFGIPSFFPLPARTSIATSTWDVFFRRVLRPAQSNNSGRRKSRHYLFPIGYKLSEWCRADAMCVAFAVVRDRLGFFSCCFVLCATAVSVIHFAFIYIPFPSLRFVPSACQEGFAKGAHRVRLRWVFALTGPQELNVASVRGQQASSIVVDHGPNCARSCCVFSEASA